jgi:hypothetical protein
MDIYTPWYENEYKPWLAATHPGEPAGSIWSWNTGADTASQKAALDQRYIDALAAYNKQYGTSIAPDQSVLGANAQPNQTVGAPGEPGGWLNKIVSSDLGKLALLGGGLYLGGGLLSGLGGTTAAGAGAGGMDALMAGAEAVGSGAGYGSAMGGMMGAGAAAAPMLSGAGSGYGAAMGSMVNSAPVASTGMDALMAGAEGIGSGAGYGAAMGSMTGAGLAGAGSMDALMKEAEAIGSGAGYGAAMGSVVDGGLLSKLGSGIGTVANALGTTPGGLLGTALNGLGGYLNTRNANEAAKTMADAQIKAAQIAADAAKFRPVGVTTNFGSSNFGYDGNGNLVSAGYTLDPRLQAQQNQIMSSLPGLLNQFTGSQAATAGMGTAGQRAMALGNQYLAADPQAQAAKFMSEQEALLAPRNAETLANLRSNLAATGRMGLMVGGDAGMMAANPELQAYYNALKQQQLQLAANATQGGMDYAKFGAGLAGTGGDLLSSMYKTQANAMTPYSTGLSTANDIEGLGQNAMNLGTSIGAKTSTATANAGNYIANGMINSANTLKQQQMDAGSPWGNLLSGLGTALPNYKFGN